MMSSSQRSSSSSRRRSGKNKGKGRADPLPGSFPGQFRAATPGPAGPHEPWDHQPSTSGLGLFGDGQLDEFGQNPLSPPHSMGRSFSLNPAGELDPTSPFHGLPQRPHSSVAGSFGVPHVRSDASALAAIARPGHFHRNPLPVQTKTPYSSPVVGGAVPSLSGRQSSHASSGYGYSAAGSTRRGYDDRYSGYASSQQHGRGYGTASMSSLGSGFSSVSRFTAGSGSMSSLGAVDSFDSGNNNHRYGHSFLSPNNSGSSGWSSTHASTQYRGRGWSSTPASTQYRGRGRPTSRYRGAIYEAPHDDLDGMGYALAGLSISGHGHGHGPVSRHSRRFVPQDLHSGPTFVVEPSEAGSDEYDEYHWHGSGSGLSDSAYTDEYEADYDYDEDEDGYSGGDVYYDEYSD
uniref:Uncharacterized protein n=1 Tax=Mycena chlorophos TaxID=658473 RepID=A0ABQ0M547_MYCCL|nr:predicted protein [Mycena chlorophos]GAT58440.1 predicted protein [Mycena chlorophos]